ncbi:MAG: 16S rRNA (guanine(966)-N(2))-methyltransferase RsmD [Rhizobacter sp.]|nr:16S rRNA (guanine(966)-N(2))-methyltransferase RsmD [Chlorobiales bacterium]
MRIIAGKYKRRLVGTVESLEVRPTTDRVRETVFNLLATRFDFENANVLDLFAGSGVLGFEAMSRGAQQITFVEQNMAVAKVLQQSIEQLKVEKESALQKQDAMGFLKRTAAVFDLIFCDPPYKSDVHSQVIDLVFSRNLLSERGYLVLEHHESQVYSEHEKFAFSKAFGITVVSFFEAVPDGTDEEDADDSL